MKVAVLGAGAWGTALALVLHRRLHDVVLWGHDATHLAEVQRARRNERYLPGIELPADWIYESDIRKAVADAECAVIAVPSKAIRATTAEISDYRGILVSVTKGIEDQTGLTMSGVVRSNVPHAQIAALSGPTLAMEVARGIPSAIVAASNELATAQAVQGLFHSVPFRVYTSTDLLGVELGGALKNVVAIAAGVCDGFGFGDNSKAALLTRGIGEMRRLGVACGAQAETFAGLSGLGDLTVTCFSKLSRNRGLGERLGRGEKLDAIMASSVAVAEGYPTAKSAHHLAESLAVTAPIIDEVYAVLYKAKPVAQALRDLVGRESRSED